MYWNKDVSGWRNSQIQKWICSVVLKDHFLLQPPKSGLEAVFRVQVFDSYYMLHMMTEVRAGGEDLTFSSFFWLISTLPEKKISKPLSQFLTAVFKYDTKSPPQEGRVGDFSEQKH